MTAGRLGDRRYPIFLLWAFSTNMATKRKHHESDNEDTVEHNDHDVDISSALTAKKPKTIQSEDEDEDDLANFIRSSIAKRSMKEGTKIVKKSKGKDKIVKGEVGGGSFQSMGKFRDKPFEKSSTVFSFFFFQVYIRPSSAL